MPADRILLRVSGEIDLATADDFAEALRAAVAACEPARTVVVDMADVTFLSASGVGCLVEAARLAGERESTVRVVGCSGALVRTLRHTGTAHLLGDG